LAFAEGSVEKVFASIEMCWLAFAEEAVKQVFANLEMCSHSQ
jgi:hypothetical protein